ncbi:hypothetical protein [Streptomyces sp. NBC_01455]|uniref:hypothetical protein n=1 Tax=Streptomyces sp. NBC_01455 TaxID=2903874 RepID=UPI002E35E210|nr:hypothetical protein [Streptomyces sp. NBC_01455]
MTTTASMPATYGPLQFPGRAGLTLWQFSRARRLGLISGPDAGGGRWSAAVFNDALARIDAVRQAVGTMPDVGAVRAEEQLAERFSMTVHSGTAAELARRGHLPVVGDHKGHALYCGLALGNLTNRRKVERASAAGQLHLRDVVPLYRQADLDRLARSRRVDWAAVRATPKGHRSPLAGAPHPEEADSRTVRALTLALSRQRRATVRRVGPRAVDRSPGTLSTGVLQ